MDSKVSDKESWLVKHTLSEQEFRQLILDKIERARLLQFAETNRKARELA